MSCASGSIRQTADGRADPAEPPPGSRDTSDGRGMWLKREPMSEPVYTYGGMMVRYWDLLRGDTSQWSSRPCFLRLIRESEAATKQG